MQQQVQPQQDKPLHLGERRTVVWHNGDIKTECPPEVLKEALNDPHALLWLDVVGECGSQEALLRNVFQL